MEKTAHAQDKLLEIQRKAALRARAYYHKKIEEDPEYRKKLTERTRERRKQLRLEIEPTTKGRPKKPQEEKPEPKPNGRPRKYD